MRKKRKLEHIKYALELADKPVSSGYGDLHLVHQSVSRRRVKGVDTGITFLGKPLRAPLMINAITGGHPQTGEINRHLSRAARLTGVAMAVGSQKAALEDPSVSYTYGVVREENPDGLILGNLSAGCTYEEALAAVEMLGADALQLHVNTPQEVAMTEGEPEGLTILDNIAQLVDRLHVPVIVKEVGFGLSREAVADLYNAGVRYMDVGGRGGTNFIAIEGLRKGERWAGMEEWGIPTAISLLEGLSLNLPVSFVASGGLRSAVDVVKSLVVGAEMTAMARPFLEVLLQDSPGALEKWIEDLVADMEKIMFILGAPDIRSLRNKPLVVTGFTAQWLAGRGVDITRYSCRTP